DERPAAMRLISPAARLNRSPRQEVDGAGTRGDGVQGVAAIGIDANVLGIGPAHRGGTIIGLQNPIPEVLIFKEEGTGVGDVLAASPVAGIGGVLYRHTVPAPAIHLENSPRGDGADKGEVIPGFRIRVANTVESTARLGKTELAQQPSTEAAGLQSSQCGIFRHSLGSIVNDEPPQL